MIRDTSQNKALTKMLLSISAVVIFAIIGAKYSPAIKNSAKLAQPAPALPEIEKDGPLKIEEKVFGHSAAGKEIKGYVVGNGNDTLLLFASMHGDEMGTTDLLEHLVREVKANNNLVDKSKKLIVIPISNPDGYFDRTDKLNANGVNLNLNFGTSDWQTRGPEGTFAGKEAFSEPESRVIKEVIEEYKPGAMISFHAQGAVVSPESSDASINFAKWYAKRSGYEYYTYWEYPGTATKWFEESTGKPAITVELKEALKDDWESNKIPLLELISSSADLENLFAKN